jgi:hypothetical protein
MSQPQAIIKTSQFSRELLEKMYQEIQEKKQTKKGA